MEDLCDPDGLNTEILSSTKKTDHPESNLIRMLMRLMIPSDHCRSSWVSLISSSLYLTAHEFSQLPSHQNINSDCPIERGLQLLTHLSNLKSPISDGLEVGPTALQTRDISMSTLLQISNIIIDIIMSIIILKSKYCAATISSGKTSEAQQSSEKNENTELTIMREKQKAALNKINSEYSHHQYQSFTFYIIDGVRGLFLSSQDHRLASAADCLEVISEVKFLNLHEKKII